MKIDRLGDWLKNARPGNWLKKIPLQKNTRVIKKDEFSFCHGLFQEPSRWSLHFY